MFLVRLTPDKLFPDRPAERCGNTYLNNIDLLVDRYLHIAEKRVETARLKYADPVQYEKHKAIVKATKPKTPTTGEKYLPTNKVNTYIKKYDISLNNYCLGSFNYLGDELQIYKNIPDEIRHYSLTCFYTDVQAEYNYYFNNVNDLIPMSDFTDKFLLDFDIFKIS